MPVLKRPARWFVQESTYNITASKADLTPEDLVDTYLTGTPFHSLFLTPIPLELPAEQRFSGHWIIAPPGRGKTTLLHSMFLDDVKRDASIIVMNSKGDLINPIKEACLSGCYPHPQHVGCCQAPE